MKDTDLVCFCREVTYGEIRKAISEGHKTIEELSELLGVAISCGYCIETLEEILEDQ